MAARIWLYGTPALKTELVRESSRRKHLQRFCPPFLKRSSQKMSEPACAETPSVPSPSLFSLAGKTALVTGGTRGIGAACAIALAQAGADICLVQRDDTSNTATRDTIRSKYSERKCEIVVADLSNPSATREAFDKALEVMGGEIHILINCAGIQRRAPAVDFSEQDWSDVSCDKSFFTFRSRDPESPLMFFGFLSRKVIQTNLTACWTLCQAAGRHMVAKRRGKIINFASLLTFQGGITVPAYAAAKGLPFHPRSSQWDFSRVWALTHVSCFRFRSQVDLVN